jgi:2-dehydropantoate 2-reductase
MISPTTAILGAGAVGGYYGARLAQHGHDVHFLMRSGYEHVREHGLMIRSVDGDFVLPAERICVYDDVAAMPRADLVIVTLKSTENHHLARLIPPLLHDETAILTLQNGLGNENYLADLFGARRIIGGMAFVCINREGPGRIDHQESGYVRIAEFQGAGRSARVGEIVEMFNASRIRTSAIDDLKAGRWDKLVWNIPFNGLTALLDVTTDRLLASERGVQQVRAIMQEVIAAARADGVTLAPERAQQQIDVTRRMGAYRTSTQIDRQTGRPMEVEAIFGRPVEVARRGGVPVPLMELLYLALSSLSTRLSGDR